MKKSRTFLFVSFVFWIACSLSGKGEIPSSLQPWRRPENAGVNVLCCYLKATGHKYDYEDLLKEQSKEIGTGPFSAVTLMNLAGKEGVPLKTVSLTMDSLISSPKPVIVHVDGDTPETGTFLLLFDLADGQVLFLDGPSVSVHMMSTDDFRRVWSGFALLPSSDTKKNLAWGVAGGIAGLLVCAFCFSRFMKQLFRMKK